MQENMRYGFSIGNPLRDVIILIAHFFAKPFSIHEIAQSVGLLGPLSVGIASPLILGQVDSPKEFAQLIISECAGNTTMLMLFKRDGRTTAQGILALCFFFSGPAAIALTLVSKKESSSTGGIFSFVGLSLGVWVLFVFFRNLKALTGSSWARMAVACVANLIVVLVVGLLFS